MTTLIVPLIFIVISTLLLWFIIENKRSWLIKSAIISAVLIFSMYLWEDIHKLMGWATPEPLPAKFRLHSGVINEPEEIFVWIENLEIGVDKGPRSHIMGYSRELHDELAKILEQIGNGRPFYGTCDKELIEGEKNDYYTERILYELPPTKLEDK